MRGINKVLILGRIGHDITLRQTNNGRFFVDLNIATNRNINKNDVWVSMADWHRVRFWGKEAEASAKFLVKGAPVAIEGSLRSDSWTTDEGERKFFSYVHGEKLHLLPSVPAERPKAVA
jgi:single-strand DNA-binding protein